MSEQLPTVSGKQLIRVLERKGWYVKRIRGSHHVLRHPEISDALPVPVHGNRPIKRGTLVLTMAMIVRNSWVDASGNVAAAIRADRRGLALLTGAYVICGGLLMVLTLT